MDFLVNIGVSNFAAIRKRNSYYVDKTEIIYELFHDAQDDVTLFTRPRRFGKTLTMSMMENFFNINKDSKDLLTNTMCRSRKPVKMIPRTMIITEKCSV